MATPISAMGGTLRAEQDKLLSCVHCGLCLEACPTYFHTGDENDSPRGRIYLMRAVEENRLPIESPIFARHIDRCLGCRACEQACPAGVEYGQLLETARDDLRAAERPHTRADRLLGFVLRHVWLHPSRLRIAFAAARFFRDSGLPRLLLQTKLPQLISPRLAFSLAMLVGSGPADIDEVHNVNSFDDRGAASQSAATQVMLFTGCVTEGLFARINRATARVLRVNGCETATPNNQVCCGALHAHAGDLEGALSLARRNIEAFGDGHHHGVPIITNAGGCGAMLLSYHHLLADDPDYAERARAFSERVRDVSQQLETAEIVPGAPATERKTTYDASCHLLYGQRAALAPLRMVRAAAGDLKFAPLEGSDVCCGGAGVYNLLQPELSQRVLSEKLKNIQQTGAQILATGNPGCHMHIGAGARLNGLESLAICHPIELLDLSYAKAGLYE